MLTAGLIAQWKIHNPVRGDLVAVARPVSQKGDWDTGEALVASYNRTLLTRLSSEDFRHSGREMSPTCV